MLRTAQLLIGRQIAQVLGTHPHARAIVARIDHLEDGTFTWSTGSCAPQLAPGRQAGGSEVVTPLEPLDPRRGGAASTIKP
jgi:hypothetical protein